MLVQPAQERGRAPPDLAADRRVAIEHERGVAAVHVVERARHQSGAGAVAAVEQSRGGRARAHCAVDEKVEGVAHRGAVTATRGRCGARGPARGRPPSGSSPRDARPARR